LAPLTYETAVFLVAAGLFGGAFAVGLAYRVFAWAGGLR
jgi:hypothetical protein